MRVVQISGGYVGAQKKIESALHKHLIENGNESIILCAFGSTDGESGVFEYATKAERFFNRFIRKISKNSVSASRVSTLRLIHIIKKFSPDIVHLHTIHHDYLNFDLLFKYLSREKHKIVYTLHDMWPFTGGCYYYSNIDCDGFLRGCENCRNNNVIAMDSPAKCSAKMLQKKMKAFQSCKRIVFVAVSDWVRKEALKTFLKDYPLCTVWNAVSCDFENGLSTQKEDSPFRIIGVATSWTDRKGINRFLQLAEILGNDYEIVLVGDVHSEIRKNAPSNIRFVGRILDQKKLFRLYETSDLHVSMSYEETFGMTFVEAAFAGIKSIGFDRTAISQVVPKVHGFLVDCSVDAVAEKVRSLLGCVELCRLTKEEHKEICDFFSVDNMCSGYISIYKSLLCD